MPTFDLGKFKLTPKGAYDSSTAYEALDVVTYNYSSYLVLQNVQGITPTGDNTNYQLLSQGVDPSDISDKKSVISALSAFIDENGDSQKVLVVSFIGYNSSGNLNLINLDILIENITSSPIYLYRDTSNMWQLSTTSPSTGYSVTPIYIGSIKTKTVNGSSIKAFFTNDDEAQFDKLNSEKVDKTDMAFNISGTVQTISSNEQLTVKFQTYNSSGNLEDKTVTASVDTEEDVVYLYKNTSDVWDLALSYPDSYHRLPIFIGSVVQQAGNTLKFVGATDEIRAYVDNGLSKKANKVSMQLLCSRTVVNTGETPASVYSFTQDDNGNAFNLSMAQVYVYVPSGANQGGSIGFYSASSRNNSIRQFTIGNIRQTSVNSGFDVKMLGENGYWASIQTGTSGINLSTSSVKNDLVASTTKIKCIDVTTYQTANGFPDGTKIKIYGVN